MARKSATLNASIPAETISNSPSRDKLNALRSELNVWFLERGNIIDGCLATVLMKGNAILLGDPGTAKSQMIAAICGAIQGANYFQRLLQKAQPPEELLGQPSIRALQQEDLLKRNTSRRLPEAHIAFLDEIFRCNPITLNAILGILNERTFENPDPTKVPLVALFGAANSYPDDVEMEAFCDRFLYRPWVEYVRSRASKRTLLNRAKDGITPTINAMLTLDELKELQQAASQVTVSDELTDALIDISNELTRANLPVSDRKLMQVLRFAQCYAFVQGEDEVLVEHLHEILPDCLWKKEGKERDEIKKIVIKIAPSSIQLAQGYIDAARSELGKVAEEYNHQMSSGSPSQSCLTDVIERATRTVLGLQANTDTLPGRSQKIAQAKAEISDILLQIAGYRDRI